MRTVVILAAGALALAACGKGAGGGAGAASAGSAPPLAAAVTLPANTPAFAAPMPGAKLETAMAMPSGKGILAYFTDAKNEEVLAYYDQQTAAAGMKKITQSPGNDHGGTGAIYASDPPGADSSKRLSVSVGPETGRTRVDIIYRSGAA